MLLATAVAGLSAIAGAQTLALSQGGAPSGYRSAFDDYRSFKEQALAPWRDVNAEVARIGGHAGSLKPANATGDAPPGMPSAGGASTPAQGASAHHDHR